MARSHRDPNTLSNYESLQIKRTLIDVTIDFERSCVRGSVTHNVEVVAETKTVVLDTSYLDLKLVEPDCGIKRTWRLRDRIEPYGSALEIAFEEALIPGLNFKNLSRDTPDVKNPYRFEIRSPLPVITSGLYTGSKAYSTDESGSPGTLYTFKQDVPIPSYLFALASGDIATASIGPRSLVATGPEELSASKWELEADTEELIQTAERIIRSVPYQWTTYNVLILRPSFPFGGMENPVYTFATPTIISGDRANVDVIARELSHSWSGNLVSPASWEHFWLNEGWTTYIERRIQAEVHGSEARRDFSALIGWNALIDSIEEFGEDNPLTCLVMDLKGKDLDDAFSSIPYEKGFVFLYYLEKLFGKAKWDLFISHYFETFQRRSLTSYEFKDTVIEFFRNDPIAGPMLEKIDWDYWFHSKGFPPKPNFDTTLVDAVLDLVNKWQALAGDKSSDFKPSTSDLRPFFPQQIYYFLESILNMHDNLSAKLVVLMESTYNFLESQNVEITARFLRLGLVAHEPSMYKPTTEFLGQVGRMKFVRPLFLALADCDRELALQTFEKVKNGLHPICRDLVRKDLARDHKSQ